MAVTLPPLRVHLFEHQAQLGGCCAPGSEARGVPDWSAVDAGSAEAEEGRAEARGEAGARAAAEGRTDAGAEAEVSGAGSVGEEAVGPQVCEGCGGTAWR